VTTEDQAEAAKPPYISYATLTGFIDTKLGSGEIPPPRIDRGFLDNYAGSVQAHLLQALRAMQLIGPAGEVTDALKLAARSPDERKRVFKQWAEQFYGPQQTVAERSGTAQMLWESFAPTKYTGSTLRKAIVFYLALAEDVGLKRSPYFKPPKQSPQAAPRKATKPSNGNAQPSATPASDPVTRPTSGEVKIVDFGEAGRVTVHVDVRWLDLPIDQFTQLRSLINELERLTQAAADDGTGQASTEEGTS
jgi:hypothetical protein